MAQLVRSIAERDPDGRALADETGETTWGELDERVNRLIAVLRGAGLGRDDRVAVLSGNRREVYEVYVAALHAGLAVVPMSWELSTDLVAHVLDHSDAKALIVDPVYGAAVSAAAQDAAGLNLRLAFPGGEIAGFDSYEEALAGAAGLEPADQIGGRALFYTSGTTGRPKGVNSAAFRPGIPIEELGQSALMATQGTGIPVGGRTLLVGPIFHSGQFAFSVFPLLCGSQTIVRRWPDPEAILDAVDGEAATNSLLLPMDFTGLLRLPEERRAAFDGSSLEIVLHGGAPCPPDVKRRMLDWWGPVLVEYYGATEGGLFATLGVDDWRAKPTSVGRPLPFIEVQIVGEDGAAVPTGAVGGVYIRNLTGADFNYHKDPQKTNAAHLEPGVFTVGDLGYLDAEGFLFVVGRDSDVVRTAAGTVYPAEVQGVLAAHPAVADVAVFGVPGAGDHEQARAAVLVAGGHTAGPALAEELRAYVAERLTPDKVPTAIDFLDELPRTAAGKLAKAELRARYGPAQPTS